MPAAPLVKRGFTLIEIMLVIALIGLIGAFSAPFFLSSKHNDDLLTASTVAKTMIRSAQARAKAGTNDQSWGVKLLPGQYVLFAGTSYSSRVVDLDSTTQTPTSVSLSGSDELVFTKGTGALASPVTLTLQSGSGVNYLISVNSRGYIE